MRRFLVHHRHGPEECGVAFASFTGHASPLGHTDTVSSCPSGGHEIWWLVDAASSEDALELLPHFIAHRSTAVEIRKVHIP
jgi:hypothetical protein